MRSVIEAVFNTNCIRFLES